MRALLAFLLCLAVAFQGIASAYAFKHPCPMEQGAQVMMMDAMNDTGDCCNDADTFAKTGKLCKTGQTGNLSSSWAVTSVEAPMQISVSSCLVTTTGFMPPSSDPSAVWRPPTIS